MRGSLFSEPDKKGYYLQFAQVQLLPQLQFWQVQPGFIHF